MKSFKDTMHQGFNFFKKMSVFELTAYGFAIIVILVWKLSSDFRQQLIAHTQTLFIEELTQMYLIFSLVFFWACMLVLDMVYKLVIGYINEKR